MHFYYIDPGLRNELGHHANYCRHITGTLKQSGIPHSVFGHVSLEPALREELNAAPIFRQLTYWTTDSDPIAGWLTSFVRVSSDTLQDMAHLPKLGPDDILFLNSAQAPQFMALLQWMLRQPPDQMPHVITEFVTSSGLQHQVIPQGLRVWAPDPRRDSRAVQYRFAANALPRLDSSRLHMFTYEPISSHLYSYILKTQVDVLPRPHASITAARNRRGARPVTVSVLGHQRPDKGYDLVPKIIEHLLERRPDVKFLAHNGAPQEMTSVQEKLRALASERPQLTINESTAGPALWQQLLDTSDLILCPYPVWRYAAAYSAVAGEAIANAIPLVVPANTTLSALITQYEGCGTIFTKFDAENIVGAIVTALERFDELAELAAAAAIKWQKTMGAAKTVEAILAYAGWDNPGRR